MKRGRHSPIHSLTGAIVDSRPDVKEFLRRLSPATKSTEAIRALAAEVAAQRLLIRAMLAYMEAQPGFNWHEFRRLLDSIDLEDGALDGMLRELPKQRRSAPKP